MAVEIYKVASSKIASFYSTDPSEIFVDITNEGNYETLTSKFSAVTEDINLTEDIIVILIPQAALAKWHFFVALSLSSFRKKEEPYNPKPIIFITALNVFQNYKNSNGEKMEYNKRKEDFKERMDAFTLDKRKYFLDSSIWHYYLSLEDWNGKPFDQNLEHIIGAIAKNYSLNLYKTLVAKEYLEFQTRLMKNSYLENFGGGHHRHIAPFVFHCETEMRLKADKKLEDLKGKYKNANIQWNILVIDDYADKNLKCSDDNKEGNNYTKTEIIKAVLKDAISDNLEPPNIGPFSFEYHKTPNKNVLTDVTCRIKSNSIKKRLIKDLAEILNCEKENIKAKIADTSNRLALNSFLNKNENKITYLYAYCNSSTLSEPPLLEQLQVVLDCKLKTQYDIFLLDYLLGKATDGKRELGSDLFIDTQYKELTKFKGPLGKYWFFPITAFSKAMNDKIQSSGISHIHDKWYIFDGADPIATPQLFRYNLFKLIELQLEQAIVTKKDIITFITSHFKTESTPTDHLRLQVKRIYGTFMHKFGMQEALKLDEKNGSKFAKSVLAYIENYKREDKMFYENMRKLLYLIGYGTHYKAPRMWDILNYIISHTEDTDDINDFYNRLIDYINELTKKEND